MSLPVGCLTYAIWAVINELFDSANALAYAAALLITTFVFLIGLIPRIVLLRGRALGPLPAAGGACRTPVR